MDKEVSSVEKVNATKTKKKIRRERVNFLFRGRLV